MRENLLEFLFGRATVAKGRLNTDLGEDVVRLFEEAEAAELEPVTAAEKKPLAAALKDVGISGTPTTGVHWAELKCGTDQEYHEYCKILNDPETLSKLAEKGWVAVKLGDSAMTNEPPQYRIGFIEIQTAELGDADKPDEKIKGILKQGQEFATTPVAVDSEENPVERETGKPDAKLTGKTKGVGEPSDGKDPEGKPKGSTKKVKESARAKGIVDKLLNEMTGTGSMGTVETGMAPGLANNPNQRKESQIERMRKKRVPGNARAALRRHEDPR